MFHATACTPLPLLHLEAGDAGIIPRLQSLQAGEHLLQSFLVPGADLQQCAQHDCIVQYGVAKEGQTVQGEPWGARRPGRQG